MDRRKIILPYDLIFEVWYNNTNYVNIKSRLSETSKTSLFNFLNKKLRWQCLDLVYLKKKIVIHSRKRLRVLTTFFSNATEMFQFYVSRKRGRVWKVDQKQWISENRRTEWLVKHRIRARPCSVDSPWGIWQGPPFQATPQPVFRVHRSG